MCVPSSCTKEDVEDAIIPIGEQMSYTLRVMHCTSSERPEIDGADIAYM